MTQKNKDILRNPEMKNTPYSVPEGYFDSFKAKARKYTEPRQTPVNIWIRLAPYAGIAAMFLFILLLGKTFVKQETSSEIITAEADSYEDYVVFSDISSSRSMEYLAEESSELSEDDIIEYLIYIGATEEYITSDNE